MIRKIILENFKAFERAEIEIKPLTVLVGPNNGGKTSLLQSISLVKQTLSASSDVFLKFKDGMNLGDFDTLINQNAEKKEMRFRFDLEGDMYFDVKIEKKENGELYAKNFSCNNGIFEYNIEEITPIKKKKKLESYTAKKFNLKFLTTDEYNPIYNPIFERLLSKPLFYREKFFFKIDFSETVGVDELWDQISSWSRDKMSQPLDESKTESRASDFYKLMRGVIDSFYDLQIFSDSFFNDVKQDFENVKYIGPIRAPAIRIYEMEPSVYEEVGLKGEHAVQILARNSTVRTKVEKSLKNIGIAESIDISPNEKQKIFEMKLKTKISEKGTNFADLGCGTAQIMPIMVQSFIGRKDSLIVIEQPELHLHPKIEADLADFFVKAVSEGKRFLLETHSDYFIERIRYNIMDGSIASEKVAIYYIEQDKAKKSSTVTEIRINSKGQYSTSNLPDGNLPDGYLTNIRAQETDKMTKKLLENL